MSPAAGMTVTIHTGDPNNTGQYNIPAQIQSIGNLVANTTTCNGVTYTHWTYSNIVVNSQGRQFVWGDAGSPMVTDGRDANTPNMIVGWLEWINLDPNTLGLQGGGSDVNVAQLGLQADGYYTALSGNLDSWLYGQTSSSLPSGQQVCSTLYVWNQNRSAYAIQVGIDFKKDPYSPATFWYYNPNGRQNLSFDIAPNATVPFQVCMGSSSTYGPSDYRFIAYGPGLGTGAPSRAPVVKTALNTMMARWNSGPTPNFTISLSSPSNDDIAHTGGAYGTVTVHATVWNIGSSGTVTIAPDTNTANSLPLYVASCETTASFAGCINPSTGPISQFSESFPAAAVKYYLFQIQGNGSSVTLDKFWHRVYFRLYNGVSTLSSDMLGSDSLAVTTN